MTPALNLLGSKKWWTKKYLLRFGIDYCNLSNNEVNFLYDECISAIKKVSLELKKKNIHRKR